MATPNSKYRGLDPIPPPFSKEYPPIALVIEEKCIACDRCVPVCFFDALVMESRPGHKYHRTALVISENCTGCGLCFEACPVEAIIWVPDMEEAKPKTRPGESAQKDADV